MNDVPKDPPPRDLNRLGRATAAEEAHQRDMAELVESLPGAVFQLVSDRHNKIRYRYVSQRVREVLGVDASAILEDALIPAGLVLPEDSATLFDGYLDSARGMQPFSVDVRIRRPDGALRWVRTFASPRATGDGYVWNGYWNDVSEEIRSRERLELAERRLREITESLPGVVYRMVFEAGQPTRYTDLTDGAQRIYGYPREAILQDAEIISRGLHPDDRVRMNTDFMNAARAGRQAQTDFRFTRGDGQVRWLRTYAGAQLIDNGVAWIGYTTDVTAEHEARARADDALRDLAAARDAAEAAQHRLRAIFDHTKIGLVMIDGDKNFSDANPTLRELLNVDDEQEFAREFPAFSPPHQPDGRPSMEKAEEMIELAFARGFNRFDWMHQTRAGEPRPCEIALTRVMLGGKPHIFATMTDMRERLLHEAELKEAWAEAQAASRAKSEFVANMSHEIRTPLNAIVGLSHLGLTSHEPERLRGYLGKIDTAAKSLLQIVNDILDFSKIEAGKLTLEATPFDLCGVLDNLSDLLNLRAAEKGLELLFAVEPGLCTQLVGDPLRLGQVLLNLTGNAIKFTERGQIVVRVDSVKKGRDFVRLRFEVTDTGIGLSRDEITRLFDSFSQADSSTTRRYGGTGLGLVISQRLVDLMDGQIGVDSEPGRGSTFYFTARFGLAPTPVRRAQMPRSLQGMRVLVVDDNSTAVSILQAHLESFGFVVDSAADGAQAVETVRAAGARGFRLVLMDWQMPGMNGIEAARRIRALARSAPTPEPTVIIMVTAFGREEVERQALAAGLEGFLIKPVNPSVLLDTILSAFGTAAALELPGSSAPGQAAAALAGARVLLVEDNEVNQEVARELLQRAGVVVELAINGQEALDRVAGGGYDAVLMDMQMPVMDGLEATRRIRRLASPRAQVPIIAMTANAMAEDRQRCLDAGMNDHIGKPVDVHSLYAVLTRWIAGSRAGISVQARPAQSAAPPARAGDFDFDTAIRQMADSRSLWEKAARRFLDSPAASAQIAGLLAQGECDAAARAAHTLKGVAATLGLLALQVAATALEKTLGQAPPNADSELAAVAAADAAARCRIAQELGP